MAKSRIAPRNSSTLRRAGGPAIAALATFLAIAAPEAGAAPSQCSFKSGFGLTQLDGQVNALAAWDDGKGPALYAAGEFLHANGTLVNRIAKWDGANWSALTGPSGTGLDEGVHALAVWDDGGGPALYVGGRFTTAGGVFALHIAKWDGTEWSVLPHEFLNGVNSWVFTLTVWDDGGGSALYLGGNFDFAGPARVDNIAKWDGEEFSALAGPTGIGVSEDVISLAAWDDGSGPALFVGGLFMTAGGIEARKIAKWNGSAWASLPGAAGIENGSDVTSFAVWDDGGGEALYMGGTFYFAGGVEHAGFAKWDGAIWSTLDDVWAIKALQVWDDGQGASLYAAGWRLGIGTLEGGIAKWNGSAWSTLSGPAGDGVEGNQIEALAVWDAGDGPALYAGGDFWSAGGEVTNHIAKWDGEAWAALAAPPAHGLSAKALTLALWDAGDGPALYTGGSFAVAGDLGVNHVAAWNGDAWKPLAGPAGIGTNSEVAVLAGASGSAGSQLYASGNFALAGGVLATNVAAWDGHAGSSLTAPAAFIQILALAVSDDGGTPALYAGGAYFTTIGGIAANRIAKRSGGVWSALTGPAGNGVDGTVRALVEWNDGTGKALYAGGDFTTAGGIAANRIAKWNGMGWTPLTGPAGNGMNSSVLALAVWDDGGGPALYAAGSFTSAGGVAANRIAKWNGSSWSALAGPAGNGLDDNVFALAAASAGGSSALYAGGYFLTAGGIAASHIAKWDGGTWSALVGPAGNGANGTVYALAAADLGDGPALYAGGYFTSLGGVASSRFGKYSGAEVETNPPSGPAADSVDQPYRKYLVGAADDRPELVRSP